jgi:hypothetical protein
MKKSEFRLMNEDRKMRDLGRFSVSRPLTLPSPPMGERVSKGSVLEQASCLLARTGWRRCGVTSPHPAAQNSLDSAIPP